MTIEKLDGAHSSESRPPSLSESGAKNEERYYIKIGEFMNQPLWNPDSTIFDIIGQLKNEINQFLDKKYLLMAPVSYKELKLDGYVWYRIKIVCLETFYYHLTVKKRDKKVQFVSIMKSSKDAVIE